MVTNADMPVDLTPNQTKKKGLVTLNIAAKALKSCVSLRGPYAR